MPAWRCSPASRRASAIPGSFPTDAGKEPLAERMKAFSDLLALVMACDQTRVFSIQFSGSVGGTVFWQVGASDGHHNLSHDEPGDQPQVHGITEAMLVGQPSSAEGLSVVVDWVQSLVERRVGLVVFNAAYDLTKKSGFYDKDPGADFPLERLVQLYRQRDGQLDALVKRFEENFAKFESGVDPSVKAAAIRAVK